MEFSLFSLLLISLFLLHKPLFSTAILHKINLLDSNLLSESNPKHLNFTPPTVYFEVTKPIKLPNTKPCSHLVLQHDFAYTYGKPPVLAKYEPPSNCPSKKFSKIVLEWKATCKGRQFDRIFGVWLGGVELLRSCTAEPRATGILWKVEKDVTRYYSLLLKNQTQTLAVYLGNLVDSTYTGIYHVNITFHFYPSEENGKNYGRTLGNLDSGFGFPADLILPISRNLPLNDGLWFEIESSTDTQVKLFKIPQNVYRAVLEVYVSFHEKDEFWYGNPPNDYIVANNLSGTPGNGPFREVVVGLDGEVAGAVWPFTVIYTGGVNPLLWRPITAIGSFDLPSYNIEITPFLGNITDGKTHQFEFSVTNALNVWYINANLHLWLDRKSKKVEGKLTNHIVSPLHVDEDSKFKGLDGNFLTSVKRSISSTGWVKSSYGNISTCSIQDFNYSNLMVMGNDGNMQIINQTINFNDSVFYSKNPSSYIHTFKSYKTFPLYLYSNYLDQGDGTYLSVANITLAFNEMKSAGLGGSSTSSLKNLQKGRGSMVVKDNLVVSGLGSTKQVYKYVDGRFCYFRNLSASNYTILYDHVRNKCDKKDEPYTSFGFKRWWSFPARRAFLDSSTELDG